jgi:hypothetical protein
LAVAQNFYQRKPLQRANRAVVRLTRAVIAGGTGIKHARSDFEPLRSHRGRAFASQNRTYHE